MGIILTLKTADLGPAEYTRRRAAKRVDIEIDHFVELYEPTIRRFVYAAASAGFDPVRVCRVLGHEVGSWPATQEQLTEKRTVDEDGDTLAQSDTEWLAEAARAALDVYDPNGLTRDRIRTIADVCDTAAVLQVEPRISKT